MLTIDNTLVEIARELQLQKYIPYFVYQHDILGKSGHKPIRRLWNEEAARSVLNALTQICENEKRQNCLHPVYPAEDTQNKHVSVVDFPCAEGKNKPWILLCAGGSYVNVWNLTEAWPTAVYFNRLGYHVFTLTYTVGGEKLLPKPLEDTAAAIAYIQRNAEHFDIVPDKYVIGGFSAGGHLAGAWASEVLGYAQYGAVKPCATLLIYGAFSSDYGREDCQKEYRKTMLGADASPERVAHWNVENIITKDYPPTYLVQGEADDLVYAETTKVLEKRMIALGVPHLAEYAPLSNHGFADGAGTDAVDWPQRADAWIQTAVK